ncbi:MAG: hypothetical protein EBS06_05425 [Proteobacteria bacterium]|nr:hypothetical protein [Pseudomonadota bacterium]
MTLATFSDLKSAIENWLNETGNQAIIDNAADFITLAECWMKENMEFRPRYLETRETLTSSEETVDLPDGFLGISQLRIDSVSPRKILRTTTQNDMETYSGTGQPEKFVVESTYLRFCPIPDQSYDFSLLYYKFPTALSESNTTNSILTNQPNIYLWASLLQAALYLKDDPQIEKFGNLLESSVRNRYQRDLKEKYSAPVQMVNPYRIF